MKKLLFVGLVFLKFMLLKADHRYWLENRTSKHVTKAKFVHDFPGSAGEWSSTINNVSKKVGVSLRSIKEG